MDTKQIEYIVMIADQKSITRAAEKLFITQSALSQQLQKLEEELDVSLFIRNKSDWIPTPEGEVYLENAREILRIKKRFCIFYVFLFTVGQCVKRNFRSPDFFAAV